jgi:hypothetical protein
LIWKPNWNYLIMFHYKVKTVYRQDGKCSFNSWMQNISNCRFYEAFQVKFYIKSKLTKSRITYSVPTVYISEIHCCIAKSPNLSTILKIENWKLSCCYGNIWTRACVQYCHFGILHVNLMFGKYRRGVAACMYF